jgi:major membrane immunogen (membrane-anchored lipoprotein)
MKKSLMSSAIVMLAVIASVVLAACGKGNDTAPTLDYGTYNYESIAPANANAQAIEGFSALNIVIYEANASAKWLLKYSGEIEGQYFLVCDTMFKIQSDGKITTPDGAKSTWTFEGDNGEESVSFKVVDGKIVVTHSSGLVITYAKA